MAPRRMPQGRNRRRRAVVRHESNHLQSGLTAGFGGAGEDAAALGGRGAGSCGREENVALGGCGAWWEGRGSGSAQRGERASAAGEREAAVGLDDDLRWARAAVVGRGKG